MMPALFEGISVSAGVAAGRVVRLGQEVAVEREEISQERVAGEIERLNNGLEQYRREIQAIIAKTSGQMSRDEAAILETHILISQDPELLKAMRTKISTERKSAPWAADEAFCSYSRTLAGLPGDYFQERASDIMEIRRRVLACLGEKETKAVELAPGSVIVAEDLGPAETLSLDRSYIAAIVTEKGGRTSHTSVLARSLGIPAVAGISGIGQKARNGDAIIVDADEGRVILHPSPAIQTDYNEKINQALAARESLRQLISQPAVTLDGRPVELWANIGGAEEIQEVLAQGAQGVGLFRTEFLYMNGDSLPAEEEQEDAYRRILSAMQGKPVVIRTLDIGADKRLPYFPLGAEDNPALGCRAIRLCLKEQDIFRIQLRALLKASVAGNLWIMFPMIATLGELQQAKNLLERVRRELAIANIPVSRAIKVGMMVEVPAAAMNADLLAAQVDFFSIGTNDLIQYLFAADRQNRDVDYLYQPLNRAVVRLISQVVESGHARGIPVGLCGEMAGDPQMTEVLVGLGLDELSMASGRILPVKKMLRSIDSQKAAQATRLLMDKGNA